MRLRYLFCSTILLACTWSCRSSSQPTEPIAPEGGESPQAAWSEAEGLRIDRLRGYDPVTKTRIQDPTEASAPLSTQDQLAQDAERLKRIRERQEFLSGAYVKRGNELIEQADLEGALSQFAQALEVMPSSQAARDGMRRVEALMGSGYAQASEFFQDAVSREAVRRAQARMSAEQASLKGDNAPARRQLPGGRRRLPRGAGHPALPPPDRDPVPGRADRHGQAERRHRNARPGREQRGHAQAAGGGSRQGGARARAGGLPGEPAAHALHPGQRGLQPRELRPLRRPWPSRS